jgi:hypothetical protein
MSTTPEQVLIFRFDLRPEKSISCGFNWSADFCDFCLELSKIKVLKMLDLQTKSAMNSENLKV